MYIVNDCEYCQNVEGALTNDDIVTSYTDGWYFFGINGKKRPKAIHW